MPEPVFRPVTVVTGHAPRPTDGAALRRALGALGVIGLIVALMSWGAGLLLERSRRALFDQLAAEGLPSRPRDLAVDGDPGPQAAWTELARERGSLPLEVSNTLVSMWSIPALRAAKLDPEQAFRVGPPGSGAETSAPANVLGAMLLVEEVAHAAEPGVDALLASNWRTRFAPGAGHPTYNGFIDGCTSLAKLFVARARWRALAEDERGAWQDVARALRIAHRLDVPLFHGRNGRTESARDAAFAACELLALFGVPEQPERRSVASALAALDESHGLVHMLQGELASLEASGTRPSCLAWTDLRGLKLGAIERRWIETPFWRRDLAERIADAIRAARVSDERPPDAIVAFARARDDAEEGRSRLTAECMDAYAHLFRREVVLRTRLRLVLTALGEANGPGGAASLVDPFSPSGATLRRAALPEGRVRHWSVGVDQLDQDGASRDYHWLADLYFGTDIAVEVAPPRARR